MKDHRRSSRSRDRYHLAAFVVLAVAVGVGFVRIEQTIRRNQKATLALCILRADLDQRIADTKDFLKQHPRGIPGISAEAVRLNIANSERTRRALRVVDCPP